MGNIFRVLTWEFARQCFMPLFACTLVGVTAPWLVVCVLFDVPTSAFESTQFYGAYFCISAFVFCSFALHAQVGLRERLFVLPLSTAGIATCLILGPLVALLLGHSLATALVQGLYGARWPWVRPLLYFGVLSIAAQVTYVRGRRDHVGGSVVFCTSMLAVLVGMGSRFLPDGVRGDVQLHLPFSIAEVIALALGYTVLIILCYRSLAADRAPRFAKLTAARLVERIENALRTSKSTAAVAPSPTGAVRDYMWRQAGLHGVLGTLLLAVLSVALQATTFLNGGELLRLSCVLQIVMSLSMGCLLGVSVGHHVRKPGRDKATTLSTFLTAKPISTPELARALDGLVLRASLLISGAHVLLSALFLAIVACFALETLRQEMQAWYPASRFGLGVPLASAILGFLGLWITARTTAASQFFGRDHWVGALALTAMALVVTVLTSLQWLPPAMRTQAMTALVLATGALVFLGTALTFLRAWRLRLIQGRQLLLSVVMFLFLATAIVLVADFAPLRKVASVGLAAVVFLATPLAPLGLYSNRHR